MRSSPYGLHYPWMQSAAVASRSAGAMPTYAALPPLRVAWSPLRGERKGLRPGAFTEGKMAFKPSHPRLFTSRYVRDVSHPSDATAGASRLWGWCHRQTFFKMLLAPWRLAALPFFGRCAMFGGCGGFRNVAGEVGGNFVVRIWLKCRAGCGIAHSPLIGVMPDVIRLCLR